MDAETEQLSLRLLGPLNAQVDGQRVIPGAAKQRQVLALLGLNAGQIVTVAELSEELWGDDPPPTGTATLQTYILHLRRQLGAASPAIRDGQRFISTRHGGYLLRDERCRTDVMEFEEAARVGRAAAEAGDYHAASDLLSRALGLWRGPAFADVPTGRILYLEAASLEEKRLGVLERRIEADLALHRHRDLLGELRLLTSRHPMNENLSGFLMISLYRAGHAGRALEEFRRLRTSLRRELGIEPSGQLVELHRAVLARDPALDAGARFAGHSPTADGTRRESRHRVT